MFNRYIFTESKPSLLERIGDYVLAIVIGLALTAVLLHSCDALLV